MAGTDQLSRVFSALADPTRRAMETAPLREAADWIDRFRRFWNTSLDRLDAHLAEVQAAERLDKKEL